MEKAIQLALFLENKPGTLAAVCDALAADNINIYALTISDTVDHSVVRMVVSDPRKALSIFEEHGTLVVESDVILIEHDNKPGSLSRVAKKLAAAGLNIEYAYLASGPGCEIGTLILRVDEVEKALQVLQANAASASER
ncbi:MAG TPA: amino acid-binding protein [Chthoniobacterales bacterium]